MARSPGKKGQNGRNIYISVHTSTVTTGPQSCTECKYPVLIFTIYVCNVMVRVSLSVKKYIPGIPTAQPRGCFRGLCWYASDSSRILLQRGRLYQYSCITKSWLHEHIEPCEEIFCCQKLFPSNNSGAHWVSWLSSFRAKGFSKLIRLLRKA